MQIKDIKHRSISENAVINGIQKVLNILLPLVTFPYITRVLEVENLGKYNFANSIVSYFAMFAALGIYTYAIREGSANRDNHPATEKLCNQVFTINIYSTIVSYGLIVILLLSGLVSQYTALIIIFSIDIFFNTLGVSWLFSVYEDYLYISIRTIAFRIISIVLIFLLVKKPEDYILYAGITVFASAGANITNFICARKYCKIKPVWECNLKTHLTPILILFVSSVASVIYVRADITVIGILKSDFEVGLYSVSSKIYSVIKGLIATIFLVSIPRLSMYKAKEMIGKFQELLNNLFNAILVLVLPIATGIFFLSEDIIVLVVGESYSGASGSLMILSVALIFSIYAWYFNQCILLPSGKEKIMMAAAIISACVNIIGNFILIPIWGINAAAFTTIISEFIMMAVGILYGKREIKLDRKWLYSLLSPILGCVLIALICIAVKALLSSVAMIIIISIACSVIGYCLMLLLLRNKFAVYVSKRVLSVIKPR